MSHMLTFHMNKPLLKFITDFGPLLVFFIVYFNGDNNLKAAIPPFVVATLVALILVYYLEKRIPMLPLMSGIIIIFFAGLTLITFSSSYSSFPTSSSPDFSLIVTTSSIL